MRMKKLLAVAQKTWIPCLLFLFVCCQAQELPGTVRMTPVKETKLVPVKLIVPEKFKGMISDDLVLNVPEGYTAKVFYTGGLSKARFFAWVRTVCCTSQTKTAEKSLQCRIETMTALPIQGLSSPRDFISRTI